MMITKYWKSKTFKDLLKQISKLSRPSSGFKDLPGPGKLDTYFKHFQWPLRANSKTLKVVFSFQGLSGHVATLVAEKQELTVSNVWDKHSKATHAISLDCRHLLLQEPVPATNAISHQFATPATAKQYSWSLKWIMFSGHNTVEHCSTAHCDII